MEGLRTYFGDLDLVEEPHNNKFRKAKEKIFMVW